jgi:hypothetical protein
MRSSATAEVATDAGWPAAVALATGSAAFALSVAVLFPGWMSYDSSFQFWQVRTGEFSNLSPVVMTALWSVVHAVAPRPSALFLLHQAAYWTGIVLLALALWRGAAARAAFIVVAGFVPPVFVILGHLWTDASLIAALSLAFGLTVTGLVRRQRWSLALALPAILYAGAVRHNSLLAIMPLAALWAHAWLRSGADGHVTAPVRSRRAKLAGIALLLVFASFAGGRALDQALARERVSTWALVALWDLAAISLDSQQLVIPDFARTSETGFENLRERFSPYTCVPLFNGPGRVRHGLEGEEFDAEELAKLRRAWLAAITAHPGPYLWHRIVVAKKLFGSYRGHAEGLFFVPTTVAYRDNPPGEAALTGWRDRLVEGVRRARGWVIFTPAVYLVIAFAAAALGWRRRNELAGQVALAFAGSGLLLVLPLVVAAPGTELRYCGWLFTASVVALTAGFARPVPRYARA